MQAWTSRIWSNPSTIPNRIAHYLRSSSILADQREHQPTVAKLAHHLLMMPNFDLYNLERGLEQLMVSL
jgi:hypothetical protein